MMVSKGQLDQILATFPKYSWMTVGPTQDFVHRVNDEYSIDWVLEMDEMANCVVSVCDVLARNHTITEDGRDLYEPTFMLRHPENGQSYEFPIEWLDDAELDEILKPPTVAVQNEKKSDGTGLSLAVGGSLLALLGMAALRKRKQVPDKKTQAIQREVPQTVAVGA